MQSTTSGTRFLHPERVVGNLGIKKDLIVADFGAGAGFYSIPLARIVGEHGKVFAVDVQKETLDLIASKARMEHLLNLETVWADLESPQGSRLPDASIDFVVISNILFQVDQKEMVMREAYRVIKPGGRCAVIEWDEVPFPGGPSPEMRVSKRLLQSMASAAGFSLDREFEAGLHHYGLLYRKQ